MFRRSVYRQVGGYRAAFRYAQDYDLWFRMAERGLIAYCPETLITEVINDTGISASRKQIQERLGFLARDCAMARRRGQSEAGLLAEAAQLSSIWQPKDAVERKGERRVAMARTAYFVGSSLLRHGHPAAVSYLFRALRLRPLDWRVWIRLCQGLLVGASKQDVSGRRS
jgi:hypothetical protein